MGTCLFFCYHDLDLEQSIKFVRDTAIERRQLSNAQRVDIVFKSKDLISSIEEKAKAKKSEYYGNQFKKMDFGPSGSESKIQTNVELGKVANVSKNTVQRSKKIKKENPKEWDEDNKKATN